MSAKIHFHFITLFPETIRIWLTSSILGRAHEAGLFDFDLYQLRDFSQDKHRAVDDLAYGGGGGMVLRVEPLVAAVESILERTQRDKSLIIYFSPAGQPLNQPLIDNLTPSPNHAIRHLILVCGHYEGVDQRFIDHWTDLQVSLGDFVLSGGELPAVALADSLIRQLEGTLAHENASKKESFSLSDPTNQAPLLEYPHYTRPAEFRGHRVPDILLSGHHEKVSSWRLEQSRERTRRIRPELGARQRESDYVKI